ncbi:MAG TPA: amidohydrolase family protein [Luteitalea sp.]|nr:amidohydrolase family protein [Luteitalea sp.]
MPTSTTVATAAGPAPDAGAPLVIRSAHIVTMARPGSFVGTVVVRDRRIAYVGPDAGAPQMAAAQVVDGRGRYLLPGLIDLHTHVSKTRASSLLQLVTHGVTTARDMGGDHEELLRWRREIDAGTRVGPRLRIAGPYLESAANATRQHATPVAEMVEPVERTRLAVGSPADADRIVAAIAARGVDHLKIRTTTDRETYIAIGAAARRHGLSLTGHAQSYGDEALAASGQVSIEHQLIPTLLERPHERAAHVRTLATRRIAVVPTLVVLERLGGPNDVQLAQAVEAAGTGPLRLAAFTRADWREQLAEQGPERRTVYGKVQAATRLDVRACGRLACASWPARMPAY